MYVGVVGTIRSGKDAIAEHLTSGHGFNHVGLSNIIREYAISLGLKERKAVYSPGAREFLQQLGNALRQKHSPAILMQLALEQQHTSNCVFTSIRNPEEVALLKQKGGVLIGVDAPEKVRFERDKQLRITSGSTVLSFAEFLENESLERSDDPTHQQMHLVLEMCDHVIQNNGTLDSLKRAVDAYLDLIPAQ